MAKREPDNLAKDAARALAADMSYGRWKALHPYTKDMVDEPTVPEGWRICQECGRPFKPKTKRSQYYCEAYCQRSAAMKRLKEKEERKLRNESYT